MHLLEPDELSTRLAKHLLRAPAEAKRGRWGRFKSTATAAASGSMAADLVRHAEELKEKGSEEGSAEGKRKGSAEGVREGAATQSTDSDGFILNAQLTRLLVGDDLGDALQELLNLLNLLHSLHTLHSLHLLHSLHPLHFPSDGSRPCVHGHSA